MHGPHRRSYFTLFLFQGLRNNPKIQNPKTRQQRHTQSITKTRNRQPEPHFQKKREAEEAEKENLSNESSEESSDLSEAEALEEGNMEAEGESNFCFYKNNFRFNPCQSQLSIGSQPF